MPRHGTMRTFTRRASPTMNPRRYRTREPRGSSAIRCQASSSSIDTRGEALPGRSVVLTTCHFNFQFARVILCKSGISPSFLSSKYDRVRGASGVCHQGRDRDEVIDVGRFVRNLAALVAMTACREVQSRLPGSVAVRTGKNARRRRHSALFDSAPRGPNYRQAACPFIRRDGVICDRKVYSPSDSPPTHLGRSGFRFQSQRAGRYPAPHTP